MGVRIIAGRAGTGKSSRCFERIVGAMRAEPLGRPVYWVVPRQETFSAERWLVTGSGLPAFSRCRVVSFESLADEVIATVGGGSRAVMSKGGRLIVMGHLLRAHAAELKYFRASARQPGLAGEILELLDEMSRNGSREKLGEVAGVFGGEEGLGRKLGDLALLHAKYVEFVEGRGTFDKDSRMEHVLRKVGSCPQFRGARFYVDGFLDLLDFERRMIVALAGGAEEMWVTFCMPGDSGLLEGAAIHQFPEETSVFHRVEMAHRGLRVELAERQVPVEVERLGVGEVGGRFSGAELLAVEGAMAGEEIGPAVRHRRDVRDTDGAGGGGKEGFESGEIGPLGQHVQNARAAGEAEAVGAGGALLSAKGVDAVEARRVRFVEGGDVRAEVDWVAREVLRLARGEGGRPGVRFREVVVLCRRLSDYEGVVRASFREHGIRVFMDRRREAGCHPLMRVLRAVLSMGSEGWSTAGVVAVAKSGLAGGTFEAACRLENWAVTKGVYGEGWVGFANSKSEIRNPDQIGVTKGGSGESGAEHLGWAAVRGGEAGGSEADEVAAAMVRSDDEWDEYSEGVLGEMPGVGGRKSGARDVEMEELRARIVSAVGPVLEGLRSEEGISAADACSRLVVMFERLGVREVLAEWMKEAEAAGEFEVLEEHRQVWKEVMGVIEEVTELVGAATVRGAELETVFLSALEGVDLGLTPPTVDQVIVGEAERTRVGDAKVAFVLGLSEGMFPAVQMTGGLLTDGERKVLRGMKFEVDADGERRQLDERLIGYLAMTRGAERLYLCRPRKDGKGVELGGSVFWETAVRAVEACRMHGAGPGDSRRLRPQMQGRAPATDLRDDGDGRRAETGAGVQGQDAPGADLIEEARGEGRGVVGDVGTARQLVGGVLRWARDSSRRGDSGWVGLYNLLALRGVDDSVLDRCRHAVWAALGKGGSPALEGETAARLWPMPLRVRDEQLEAFAACPYRHFLKYGLRVEERAGPEVHAGTVSGVMHRVMGRVCDAIVARGGEWKVMGAEESRAELEEMAAEAVRDEVRRLTWDGSEDLGRLKARDRFLLSRVSRLVSEVVRAHVAAEGRTAFLPRRGGVEFSDKSRAQARGLRVGVSVKGKVVGEAIVSGRIDRVDTSATGKVIAWDYNWGGRAASFAEMYHGLALRVLIHLLVLRDYGGDLGGTGGRGGRGGTGAFVVGMSRKVESFSNLEDFAAAPAVSSEEFQLAGRKAEGIFAVEHLAELDSTVVEGSKSAIFPVSINKDGSVRKGNTSALSAAQMEAVLGHAERTIGELAGRISMGVIEVMPYRLGKVSACGTCEYGAICRFDPRGGGKYLELDSRKGAELLEGLSPSPVEVVGEKKKGGRRG